MRDVTSGPLPRSHLGGSLNATATLRQCQDSSSRASGRARRPSRVAVPASCAAWPYRALRCLAVAGRQQHCGCNMSQYPLLFDALPWHAGLCPTQCRPNVTGSRWAARLGIYGIHVDSRVVPWYGTRSSRAIVWYEEPHVAQGARGIRKHRANESHDAFRGHWLGFAVLINCKPMAVHPVPLYGFSFLGCFHLDRVRTRGREHLARE